MGDIQDWANQFQGKNKTRRIHSCIQYVIIDHSIRNNIFVQAHLAECKFRPVQCPLCGIMIESSKLQNHMTFECPQRRIKCKWCNADITVAEQEVGLHGYLRIECLIWSVY